MVICEIKQQLKNKNRYNLYAEEGFIGALGIETIAKYAIHENSDIPAEDFNNIIREDNEKYAFDKALKFLTFSARTQSDVARYLKGKDIDAEAIESALQKLKSYGYINDIDYARQYANELFKKEGRHAIEYKLKRKGIEKAVIEEVLASFSDEDEKENAKNIYAQLSRKFKNEDEAKMRAKIVRSMAAKGYGYDLIQSIVHERED